MIHYANRKDTGVDPQLPLKTACDLGLPEVAEAGDQAADEIRRVTCPRCLAYHEQLQQWREYQATGTTKAPHRIPPSQRGGNQG